MQLDTISDLSSQRLQLKLLTEADIPVLFTHMSNPEIPRYMSWQPHHTMDETKAFVEYSIKRMADRQVIHWCVWEGTAFAGLFSLIDIKTAHRALTYNHAELAYWCAPASQRKGIMTEAGQMVIDFAFSVIGFHKLVVGHRPENLASKKLIERLGFTYTGIQREHYQKDGVWHDQLNYELLKKEYDE